MTWAWKLTYYICECLWAFLQEYVLIKKSLINFIFYILRWPCHFYLKIIKETRIKNLKIFWKHLSNTLSIQTEKDFYLIILRIVVRDQEPLASLPPQHSWIGSCYYSTNVMISVESEVTFLSCVRNIFLQNSNTPTLLAY